MNCERNLVAVDEHREAASGCVRLRSSRKIKHRGLSVSIYDRYAIGRSLVKLGNCYETGLQRARAEPKQALREQHLYFGSAYTTTWSPT